jgi:hypothetical protein
MSTPIDFNRVDKLISSIVHSCCLGTVRIFNIISLHFGERGRTNLLLSIAMLGHWQNGPVALAMVRRRHLHVATVNMNLSHLFEFFKTFHHDKNLKRLTVKDKN